MRRPARLTRAIRALTAAVTLWCLGCDALDPLISKITGTALMDCASEGGSSTRAVAGTSTEEAISVREAVPPDERGGVSCDCQSCLAPAPASLAAEPALLPLVEGPLESFVAPTSIERAPLVPPPQVVA
jgi:hypothetical protein